MTKSHVLSTNSERDIELPLPNALKPPPLNNRAQIRPRYDRIIKWTDYKSVAKRQAAFDCMAWIGFKMAVVLDSATHKNGLTRSVYAYNDMSRRYVRINWQSSHIVELELVAV